MEMGMKLMTQVSEDPAEAYPEVLELFIPGVGLVDILHDARLIPLPVICQALAREPRFGGLTDATWSVAAHSLAVSDLVELRGGSPAEILAALFHDATEGCGLKDIPTPVKRFLGDAYADLERCVQDQLERAYGFDLSRYQMWHEADRDMLEAERVLFQPRPQRPRVEKSDALTVAHARLQPGDVGRILERRMVSFSNKGF